MLIRLTEEEKADYCARLALHMKRLRAITGFTQDDLESLCGISKERISRIENGAYPMRWAQFICFMMIFCQYTSTKEYMVVTKLLTPRLLQFLQMRDSQVPPDLVIPISKAIVNEFNTDFRISSSLSLEHPFQQK